MDILLLEEMINPKHCDNKRSNYNFDWWDIEYKQPCIKNLILIQK